MVSKHSSRIELSELRELRGLETTEERDRGRPPGGGGARASSSPFCTDELPDRWVGLEEEEKLMERGRWKRSNS